MVELRYCDACGHRLPLGITESDHPVCPGCGAPVAVEPSAEGGSAGNGSRRQKPRTGHHRPVAGRRRRDIALMSGVAAVAGAILVVAALALSGGDGSPQTRPIGGSGAARRQRTKSLEGPSPARVKSRLKEQSALLAPRRASGGIRQRGPRVAATPGRTVKTVVPAAPAGGRGASVGDPAAKSAGPSSDGGKKAPGGVWTPRAQPGAGPTVGMDKAEQEEYFAKVREEARKLPTPAVVPATSSSTIRPGGPIRVLSFTLINADTDLPIPEFDPLADGATLDLAALPTRNLNVRANTAPALVGSVRFGLDGLVDFQTENTSPYALGKDTGGDYEAWTPAPGTHTLTATPYGGRSGSGEAGVALTAKFHVK